MGQGIPNCELFGGWSVYNDKEFVDAKPRTWVWATPAVRRAFADYLVNLERVLKLSPQ